jgi:hypothetical protein
MTRTYHRRTISLSPPAEEGLGIIMEQDGEAKASRVIDRLLRTELERRGFSMTTGSEQTHMQPVSISLSTPEGDLHQIHHAGKAYVEAKPGQSYTLVLSNHTPHRKLALLTVDGLNTISGQKGDFSGPGWVLAPFQTARITGWKLGSESAAAFTFGGKHGSYANKTGHGTKNVGVIGVAVFDEKETGYDFWTQTLGQLSSGVIGGGKWSGGGGGTYSAGPGTTAGGPEVYGASVNSVCSTEPATLSQPQTKTITRRRVSKNAGSSVGTQFGQKTEMQSADTTFTRATEKPTSLVAIHYGTRRDLERWGVPLNPPQPSPQAFPGEGCQPPPGWQG